MRAYWWRQRANFGDALTPLLLERLLGVSVSWATPAQAEMVACGSVLTHLGRSFTGQVWGTGFAHRARLALPQASIGAVRGPLSAELLGMRGVPLGDPALLVDQLDVRPSAEHALGVVPHWEDRRLADRYPQALHIDVSADPLQVVRSIASCERIVSSSLHGLIVADAFGLPRRWETFPRIQGGGFKFHDYAGALGLRAEPGVWVTASRQRVERVRADLLGALQSAAAA